MRNKERLVQAVAAADVWYLFGSDGVTNRLRVESWECKACASLLPSIFRWN